MKVAVGMSGGVDSSMAAALLVEAGHEVVGLFMRMVGDSPRGGLVPGDPADAQRVADRLGVPLDVIDFESELAALIAWFCAEYDRGRTPNPCVLCNKWHKFGRLLHHARGLGCEKLATGHYARVDVADGRWRLRRGLDRAKDQSYMLAGLQQCQLARALFPLGELSKDAVRRMARERGLPVHARAESQDICFLPGRDHVALLRERLGDRIEPGPLLDTEGHVLGEHPGCQCFTIGQRRGLGVALGSPRYVVRIDRAANAVVIGTRDEARRAAMTVSQLHWVSVPPPAEPFDARVQIRYHHAAAPARVEPRPDHTAHIVFRQPQAAVTPGQLAALYDDAILLAAGWIETQ
jgi:tRNA-specific 2-thiouridylase